MGIHLRPGHRKESGKQGWESVRYEDILYDIEIGSITLGNWGSLIKEDLDGYSPLYSIPNPWAPAYLFNFVLNDNKHPLAEPLIKEILNLLAEYAVYDTVKLFGLTKPNEDDPFYKIWLMAPDFIKYGNDERIYFFQSVKTEKVLGGLSKSTLLWTSQQYIANEDITSLIKNNELVYLIKHIYEKRKPDFNNESFNTFWQHPILTKFLEFRPSVPNFKNDENAPENWLIKIYPSHIDSEFYDEQSDCFVFDNISLHNNSQIFSNRNNPAGLIDSLIEQKSGNSLPMNLVNKNWVLLDTLLEPFWIKQNKVDFTTSNSNEVRSLQKGFLYPIKPEYIQRFKLSFKDLEIIDEIKESPQNAYAEIKWKSKRKIKLNKYILEDRRSIAIWPPFKSKYSPNYVIEYDIGSIDNLEKLEFYDEKGDLIKYEGPKHHSGQNFRIYKLLNFPMYIRILKKDDKGNLGGGFIEIQKRDIVRQKEKIIIGIDFGTSHTTVAYRKNDDKDSLIMDFQKSKPIVIADAQTETSLLLNFLPPGMTNKKPNTESDWQHYIPWQPFITHWLNFSNLEENLHIIEDGNIPFLYYAIENIREFIDKKPKIKENFKWGTHENIRKYRDLFLKQLITMVIVEAEAMGFENIEIRWAYPKAFTLDQYGIIRSFWENIQNELNIKSLEINKNGYSEAQASAVYFVEFEELTTKEHSIIVDIGGSTLDISHWYSRKLIWEDSVKFGGNDLIMVLNDDFFQFFSKFNKVPPITPYIFNILMRIWPYVHRNWNGRMEDFHTSESLWFKTLQTVCLFFSSVAYYIGLHLRRKNHNEPLGLLVFAGNGIHFLNLVTFGNELSENSPNLQRWIKIFTEMLQKGHGLNGKYETKILFSKKPKMEVAYGLVSPIIENYQNLIDRTTEKMFGLNVKLNNRNYQYHEWEQSAKLIDFQRSDVDFTIFNEFISYFKNSAEINFKNEEWPIINIPDNFNKEMKISLFNSFEKEEKLTNSLFFEALKIFMNHMNKGSINNTQYIKHSLKNYVKYTGFSNGVHLFSSDTSPEYFYIKKENENWKLYIVENILDKQPSREYEILFSKFFEIINKTNSTRYEIKQPALLEWNEDEGKGYLKSKGIIEEV